MLADGRLRESRCHLTVALMRFQVERTMGLHLVHAAILGLAPIAHQAVAHEKEEYEVNQRCREEDAERPKWLVVSPGDRTGKDSQHDDAYAQSLRDVLTNVKIAAGADEALLDGLTADGIRRDGDLLPALGAVQHVCCRRKVLSRSLAAFGTQEGDVHCSIIPQSPAEPTGGGR